MIDWRDLVIPTDATLGDAITRIDQTGRQIALVADADAILRGVVTDGDIRRAMLGGQQLSSPVANFMNSKPLTLPVGATRTDVLGFMKRHVLHQVPILDGSGRLVGVEHIDQLIQPEPRSNWVVLMAGGLGTRLGQLTQDTPKPMLAVGNKPILETIVESFVEQGFRRFYMAVNYKAEKIREHFGDGASRGIRVEYLCENKRLGTAGALGLLPDRPTAPLIVMNGDLLTRADFGQLLDHHASQDAFATMVVREYKTQVPFGVVRIDGHEILKIEEKPVQRHLVNAGIYVLSPEALDYLPADEFFDMPSLFDKVIAAGHKASAFEFRDYWLDVGHLEELERAKKDWGSAT